MITKTFVYGSYRYKYSLIRQDRKTLSLTVEPCLDIILKAPFDARDERLETFLQKKWMWLNNQLTYFEKYQKKHYLKEYLSGESFYYLGRQYRLIVVKSDNCSVSLSKGKITISTSEEVDDGLYNQTLLENWYKQRRVVVFNERYCEMLKKFEYGYVPKLSVRIMAKRWGSFLKGDRIVLNPLLIHASKEAIDYVITHELCHMKYKNHDAKFVSLMDIKSPDWRKTKVKLELLLG